MKKSLYFLFFILIPCISVQSQNLPVYQNLVFEGAGIRGICYVGAVEELHTRGIIDNIERVGGTSAGAIIALAISLGYSPEELKEMLYNLDFAQFNDGRWMLPGGVNRMINNYGYYPGEKVNGWLASLIKAKTGNPDITLLELKEQGFKALYVTGSSINNQRLVIFSHENYPKMKVRDAVRISFSIPFYFEPVIIDKMGIIIKNPESMEGLDIMVDGGVTANFPIRIFDDPRYNDNCMRPGFSTCFNPATLGVRIDSHNQIEYDRLGKGLAPVEINDFEDYVGAFYNYVIESLNRQDLHPEDWQRTISVSSLDVGPKIRGMSTHDKDRLVESGRTGVREFFEPENAQNTGDEAIDK